MSLRRRGNAAILFVLLLAGCADLAKYQAAAQKFQSATAVVIAAAKTTYAGLNSAERTHYAGIQVAQKKLLDIDEMAKAQVLTPEETKVRMNALDVLSKFSDLLVQLAAAPTTANVKSKATSLQQSLGTLSGDVDKLAGGNSTQFQAQIKNVFPLIGSALTALANAKTAADLRKAMSSAMQPVDQMIDALDTDMRNAHTRERNFLSGRRAAAYGQYHADLDAKADAKLQADADAIVQLENQWETFENVDPVAGLEAMKHAYAALAGFIQKSNPSAADGDALTAAVDSFTTAAQQAGQAAQTFAK